MDLPRRVFLSILLLFLLYVLLFSSPKSHSPVIREFKNAPLDDLVWRFIYGVRNCLKSDTDYFDLRNRPYQEYWRRLPAISDKCGVNPQMSVRSYPTDHQFNLYFVQNMNKSDENEKCTVVSYIQDQVPKFENKMKRENPSCRVMNYKNADTTDITKRVNSLGRVNALYLHPTTAPDAHAVVELLQAEARVESPICQVNLLYPEPSERNEWQFVSDFNKLLTEGKYLLLKAEKDFSGTFMNLFLVNFSDEFCRRRYFKMYTFD